MFKNSLKLIVELARKKGKSLDPRNEEGTENKSSKLINGPWLPLVWGLWVPTIRAIGFEDHCRWNKELEFVWCGEWIWDVCKSQAFIGWNCTLSKRTEEEKKNLYHGQRLKKETSLFWYGPWWKKSLIWENAITDICFAWAWYPNFYCCKVWEFKMCNKWHETVRNWWRVI